MTVHWVQHNLVEIGSVEFVSESDSDFISEGCMMYSTLEMYAILVLGA